MISLQVLQELRRLLLLVLLVEFLQSFLVLLTVLDVRIVPNALDALEVPLRVEAPLQLLKVLVLLL
jgi:hypothetical protein